MAAAGNAVLIQAGGWPDRLEALLELLARQQGAGLHGRDVLLVLDGGRGADGARAWSDGATLAQLDLFRRHVPHGLPLPGVAQLGPERTRERGLRLVFEELGAPAAIVVDDGMLAGAGFLAAANSLAALLLAEARLGPISTHGDPCAPLAAQRAAPERLLACWGALPQVLTARHWREQRPILDAYWRASAAAEPAALAELFQSWGSMASDTSYAAALAWACALTGTMKLRTAVCLSRRLAPVPAEMPGFGGVALFEDAYAPRAPDAPTLAALLAEAAATLP